MKIRNCMALIGAVVALSACGRTVIMREGNSSEGTSSAVIEPVAVGKKTAKEKIDLSGLSHDKVGYGQGVLVDEKNRTTGALDFNAQYGKLNAKAINNDDKIYLTFDQGYENGYTEKILDVLKEKGYNPINQIVGYILSEDPTYITTYNNARSLIRHIDRDELLQALVKSYLES